MKKLLLVEDEISFAQILLRRLSRYGFSCNHVETMQAAFNYIAAEPVAYVILDMKLANTTSLPDLAHLRERLPDAKIVLLTGYASIATAVEAIKAGADDYLAKPVSTDALLQVLDGTEQAASPSAKELEEVLSPARLEWEHIQQSLKLNQGNISKTARQLGMHRRTLQRKLLKKPSL